MKKLIKILLASVIIITLALSLVACGDSFSLSEYYHQYDEDIYASINVADSTLKDSTYLSHSSGTSCYAFGNEVNGQKYVYLFNADNNTVYKTLPVSAYSEFTFGTYAIAAVNPTSGVSDISLYDCNGNLIVENVTTYTIVNNTIVIDGTVKYVIDKETNLVSEYVEKTSNKYTYTWNDYGVIYTSSCLKIFYQDKEIYSKNLSMDYGTNNVFIMSPTKILLQNIKVVSDSAKDYTYSDTDYAYSSYNVSKVYVTQTTLTLKKNKVSDKVKKGSKVDTIYSSVNNTITGDRYDSSKKFYSYITYDKVENNSIQGKDLFCFYNEDLEMVFDYTATYGLYSNVEDLDGDLELVTLDGEYYVTDLEGNVLNTLSGLTITHSSKKYFTTTDYIYDYSLNKTAIPDGYEYLTNIGGNFLFTSTIDSVTSVYFYTGTGFTLLTSKYVDSSLYAIRSSRLFYLATTTDAGTVYEIYNAYTGAKAIDTTFTAMLTSVASDNNHYILKDATSGNFYVVAYNY